MRKLLLVVCCLVLLSAHEVSAQQYFNNYQYIIGERAAGMGGAYTAIANDSTALWYNPAGLARISDMHLNISGNTYSYLTTKTEGYWQLPKQGNKSESINMEESDFSVVANTLIFGKKLGDGQAISFGIITPYQDTVLGSMKAKDFIDVKGDTINFQDETALNSKYYLGMIGYGIQAADNLGIGASIGIGYYNAQLKDNYFLHFDYTKNPGTESVQFYQGTYEDTEYTIQAGFGAQMKSDMTIDKNHILGFYVQTPTYRLSGNINAKEVCYNSGCKDKYNNDVTFSWNEQPIKNDPFKQILPGFVSLGYGYEEPDSFNFSLDVVPVFPVSGDGFYKNPIVNVKAGLETYLSDSMIVRAGAFTDFSQKDEVKKSNDDGTDKINYYGGTLSVSLGKHLMETEVKKKGEKGAPTPIKRTLWSTFGIVARYGIGDVKTTMYNKDYAPIPQIKDKSVLNFQAFIAESMSF